MSKCLDDLTSKPALGKPKLTVEMAADPVNKADRSVNLTCHAEGYPSPTITWTLSDQWVSLYHSDSDQSGTITHSQRSSASNLMGGLWLIRSSGL